MLLFRESSGSLFLYDTGETKCNANAESDSAFAFFYVS